MRRRDFIMALGGAAAAWPLAAPAQQRDRMRRIGVLMAVAANDPESPGRVSAFAQGLQQLGWTIDGNVRVDYRWSAGDADEIRKHTAELIALAPDVILTAGASGAGPLLQATRTIPVVFVIVPDPVGAGFVESLARPGGNATGFQEGKEGGGRGSRREEAGGGRGGSDCAVYGRRSDWIAPLALELVDLNVDIVVPVSGLALNAVRSIRRIPIVAFDLETDAISSGLIGNLARPGGNVTGVFFDFPDFSKKWLELLKEAVGGLSSVGILRDPAVGLVQLNAAQSAAALFNIRLDIVEVRGVADLDNAFLQASQRNVGAVIMMPSPMFGTNPKRIASLALRYRLPAITVFPQFAREGGLMAYGVNLLDGFRQTGGMAAKVLKGAKPAELPVELPTKFEMVINLKTANVLGITIPATLLARADEVIE